MTLQPHFLKDEKGKTLAVQLSVKEYKYLLEELEMKEDIALYERVKNDNKETYIPLKKFLKQRK